MNHSLTPLALDPSELARLRSGGVVQRAPGGAQRAGASALGLVCLPVAPAQAWDLLSRWERIGEIIPSLRFHVARESVDAAGVRHALIASELSVALLTMRYTCRVTFDARSFRQAWSLMPADELELLIRELPSLPRQSWMLREAIGSMELHAWEDGCLLAYRNLIVPRKGVPRSLEGLLTRQLVRELLSGLRAYFCAQREQSPYAAAVQPNASAR
jgi:hypothetical protein